MNKRNIILTVVLALLVTLGIYAYTTSASAYTPNKISHGEDPGYDPYMIVYCGVPNPDSSVQSGDRFFLYENVSSTRYCEGVSGVYVRAGEAYVCRNFGDPDYYLLHDRRDSNTGARYNWTTGAQRVCVLTDDASWAG